MALHVDDPYTEETSVTVELSEGSAVDRVLDLAVAASRDVRSRSLAERKAICEKAVVAMEANAEEIAKDISKMMGKPVSQAKGEVKGMAARARHMISIADQALADLVLPAVPGFERRIAKEALGVVFCLPAWNYPLLTAVNAVIPAVLAGNAVVLKHSPRSPLCGEHFAAAFRDAGAPAAWVQALHCDHPTSERIAGDSRVNHVVFTGSVLGGHRINEAAAKGFASVGLELGGNDPAYVALDCDMAKTVENVVDGAMYNAGQSCCAVERAYVHASVYDAFVAQCEPLVKAYVLGDPRADATNMGPIAQPYHPGELEELVQEAVRGGAKLVCGGKRFKSGGKGRFFEPTLLIDVPQTAKVMQTEAFGPILPIARVESDEEALAKMNDSKLGLTASVWTADVERARRMMRDLAFGTVYMNRCDSLDPALPWTGVKDSGRGVTLSALGFDHMTRPKAVHFRTAWL